MKTNIIANYIYLIYVTLIGILVMPLFFSAMGAEAFGLIGFYTVLQTWFVLMDFGLTAALSRECARFRGGAISAGRLLSVLGGVGRVFLLAASIGVILIFISAAYLARYWLDLQDISPELATTCIKLMAIAIALRWMASLHRGILNGFEKQLWTSSFGILVATLRFPVCYLVIINFDTTPLSYFTFQLVVAVIELLVTMVRSRSEIRKSCGKVEAEPLGDDLRVFLKFSLSISLLGIIATLVTQVDKLLLSRIIPLSDYGDFYLVTVLAGGVVLLGGPIASAVIPRLAKLIAESKGHQVHRLYSTAVLSTGAIVFATSLFMAMFANQILTVWTWDVDFADRMTDIFAMYAVANSIYVVSSFAHYLQFAHGNMRIQIIYNVGLLLILVPATIFATIKYGALGASFVWLIANALGFLILMGAVNAKYLRVPQLKWLRVYVAPSFIGSFVMTSVLRGVVEWSDNRVVLTLQLAGVAILSVAAAIISSRRIRRFAASRVRKYVAVKGGG